MSVAPGLVSYPTSDTRGVQTLTVTKQGIRVNRMKRGTLTAARLISSGLQRGGRRFRVAMLTLTYRPDASWSSRQVTALLKALREWGRRQGVTVPYTWVLELTKRGVPHYHILVWLPRGLTLPKPDKRGWWPHGMTRVEWARNAVGYLAKYTSKGDLLVDEIPAGARLHGCGGMDSFQRSVRTWWLLPGWVRDVWDVAAGATRVAGGFLSRSTGELLRSPWRLVERAKDWTWVTVECTG